VAAGNVKYIADEKAIVCKVRWRWGCLGCHALCPALRARQRAQLQLGVHPMSTTTGTPGVMETTDIHARVLGGGLIARSSQAQHIPQCISP
jgi:hypothetical protein